MLHSAQIVQKKKKKGNFCLNLDGMGEGGRGTFVYPEFWNYPPYFTLQPVAETQEKQKALWRGLILNYCQSTRTFRIRVDDEQFEPFHNKVIDSECFRVTVSAICSEIEWLLVFVRFRASDETGENCLLGSYRGKWKRKVDWNRC